MTHQTTQVQLERELYVLTELAKALTVHQDVPELLHTVMDRLAEVLDPAEFGLIFTWDPSEGLFHLPAAYGVGIQNPRALHQIKLQEHESITGKVHAAGQPLFLGSPEEIAQAQADMRPENRSLMVAGLGDAQPQSLIAAPLRTRDHKYGVLFLVSLRGPILFSESDMPFIETVADLIAQAIDRARLENESADIRLASQSEKLRAEALATLSHELRTPLAAIKGYATAMLLDDIDWPQKKRQEFLTLIDRECDNLQTMIKDLLDSSLTMGTSEKARIRRATW